MNLTALGFLGIYVLGLFLALFRHPIFGLCTYLWAFYLHPPTRWWGESLPDLRWSLTAALITLIATIRMPSTDQPPWHTNWGARLLIMYTVWMWLQSAWAVSGSYHLEGCILFTKYVMLFYIIYRTVADLKTFELFGWTHILGCFIFGWIAYGTVVSGRLDSVGGPGMDDANLLGMHQITGLAFAGYFFLSFHGIKRWLALAAIPFILNSIILTISRGAFLGILGAGLVALLLSPKGKRFIIIIVLILGTVLFFRFAPDEYWERISTLKITDESQMEESQRGRIYLLRFGLMMSKDYPWGAGYRGHLILSPYYMPESHLTYTKGGQRGRSAHNTLLAILVEQGYPGLIIYTSLQIWVWLSIFQLSSSKMKIPALLGVYPAILGTSLGACLICGLSINTLIAEVQIWLIALLAALKSLYSLYYEQKPLENRKNE